MRLSRKHVRALDLCFVCGSNQVMNRRTPTLRHLGKVAIVFMALVLTSLTVCYGQDVSGMTGTVTDPSGAAVPGAEVTLKNAATGAKFAVTTNATGAYRFSEILPGQGYEATFTAKGFAPLEIKDIYLTVANIRTQNATLTISAQAEAVEVTATNSEVTLNTNDATIGITVDVESLNNLPVQQRNDPTALFTLQPGVTDTGSVTGARVDQNNVTVDGLDVNDFATGGAQQSNTGPGVVEGFGAGTIVGHAPVDSLEEFNGNVAGNQASSGPAGGGQFQLVTKSGTNKFHGNVNEYHRDPSLVANTWFNNNSTPIVPRNHLIQNQFGGNIGGPIMKDKLFFFFDYNNSRTISSVDVQRTVPLDTMRAGNLGYIDSTGATSYLSPTQLQALDPAGIGADANWVSAYTARFPHSNNQESGDGVNSGGYLFNAPNNDYETNYIGRGDYNLNGNQKLFAKFGFVRENAVFNPNEFAGDPATDPVIDRSYDFVIGHTWVIGSNKTNQVSLGETVQKLSFPNTFNPDGSTFFTFSDGTGPALASSLYLNPNAQARRVPIEVVRDDFSWTRGSHTWQAGGSFKDILAHTLNVGDFNATEIGMGGNILGLCGPTPGDCGQTGSVPNPSLRPADVGSSQLAIYDYDQAYAFMLGRIADISADFNYNASGTALKQLTGDQRYYRNYQSQFYAQDTWKMTPSLTVSYGVTYQLFSVPYETRGLESLEPLTFNNYLKARVAQSSASLSGPTAVPVISYILGGKANKGGPPIYQPQHNLFAPHLGFAWNPRFDKKTVINGGAGIVYDRTVITAVEASQDADSYLFQQDEPIALGISGDPYNTIKQAARLASNTSIAAVSITPPATPRPPYAPFTGTACPASLASPCGLQEGLAFNATIDPSLKTPYSVTYNAGIQHSFQGDMVLKISYAGRLGRRLLAQPDANQVLEFPDPKSGQLLSAAFGAVTKQLRAGATSATVVPQPWFENVMGGAPAGFTSFTQFLVANIYGLAYRGDFGDTVQFLSDVGAPLNVGSSAQFSENTFFSNQGSSSYNGLLVALQKNRSHGLQYGFNYTMAHSIDNVSFFANSTGATGIGGIGLICDVIRPRECRANSDFDVKHYITADANYDLPFGKGRTFFATASPLANEIIGGWALSGITVWHTGQAFGTNSNAFDASYSNDAPGILIGPKSAVATNVTKLPGGSVNIFANPTAAAAAYEGPIGFQIGARNGLRAPRYFDQDLGLAKAFPVYGEKINLKFRADAFNAFNHPSFISPAENVFNGLDQQDITSSTFGQISYTAAAPGNLNNGARVLQLSLRLEF